MRAVALAVALVAVGASCTPTTPTAPGPVATVTIGAESATATVTGGATVTMSVASPASLPPAPSGVVFPLGALRVTVGSVTPGAVVHVSIALTAPVTGVKKLIAGVWDPFTFDGTTGATLSGDGRTISLDLQDGGRGDSDGVANGTIVDPAAPTNEQLHAVDVGVGNAQSCALTDVGEVYCWGIDFRVDSQAPDHNYSIPFKIDGISGATQLSVGSGHACVVTDQQKVECWGDGTSGSLGDGLYGNHNVTTPFEVPGLTDVAKVIAGSTGTCAVTMAGALYCWGPNYWGQVDPGTYNNLPAATPTLIDIDPVVSATIGDSHACALLATGTVSCWGNNFNAQVGSEFYVPGPLGITPLAGVTGATALTTGYVSNCVIAGATVRCWGYNYFGNLGTGSGLPGFTHIPSTLNFSSTPIDVGVDVNGGCAAIADGTLSCWGVSGFIGTGATDYGVSGPATVPGLTGVTAVGVGGTNACAVHDGGVACWGSNDRGQLGDGTNVSRYVPTPVIGFG